MMITSIDRIKSLRKPEGSDEIVPKHQNLYTIALKFGFSLIQDQYLKVINSLLIFSKTTQKHKRGENLPYYWTFCKVDRAKATSALNGLKKLPKNSPNPGIKVYYIGNVFGEWDNCVWFEADNDKHAMEYVQNTLSKIPGMAHTYTCPTSPIREYFKNWK